MKRKGKTSRPNSKKKGQDEVSDGASSVHVGELSGSENADKIGIDREVPDSTADPVPSDLGLESPSVEEGASIDDTMEDAPDSTDSTADVDDPGSEPGTKVSDAALVVRDDQPPTTLFIVPHENIVIFPELVAPLVLQDSTARKTSEQAKSQTDVIGCLLQRPDAHPEKLTAKDLRRVGCLARVMRTLTLPDDSSSLLVRGLRRFRVVRFLRTRPVLIAKVEYPLETRGGTDESLAMMRSLRGLLRKILDTDTAVPDEFKVAAANIESPSAMADFAATYFLRDSASRQGVLETFDVQDRLEQIIVLLTREVGLLELGKRIQDQIRERMEEQQRDFFLREQLKEIRKELGEAKDEKAVAVERLEERLEKLTLPEQVEERFREELDRFQLIPMESPESAVIRNYLEWIASLPWGISSADRGDLDAAEKLLQESHFGLDEAKERVLEFLAVRKLKPDHRGPILCFVGPPGVGKTSLGRSIAESLGRKFVRISLGGVRDEAEIRGHRRTYVGALPGRILQGLKTAGSNNPVFMLDELDKVGVDFRGDPASALLEALDPEQNREFSDHFLEVPFDLSRVLFVATANTLATIPPPLLDRVEIIEIPGYTANEKVGIAQKYLFPRQLERHGLAPKQVTVGKPVLRELIHNYTREAGVRHLEQLLARICRKVATRTARGRARKITFDSKKLVQFLGPARFHDEKALETRQPGVVVGLSWTPVGGFALSVEVSQVAGRGQLTLTGMLGDVMLESAKIALSHVRANAEEYGFEPIDLAKTDIHIHVPAGAVPKDGPSAGITIATALVSLFRRRPIRSRIAMTGELTLTGRVLPVGGLRNKVLAARRAGVRDVILSADNRPDIDELNDEARSRLQFHFVENFSEVVALAFPERAGRTRKRRQEARK